MGAPFSQAMLSIKFQLTSVFIPPVDSDKSVSPLVDETQPFAVPFRPYAWSSYRGPGFRPLVQQSLYPGVDVDRGPTSIGFYGDRSAHSSLYAERALEEETYSNYRRHAAALLFPGGGLHPKTNDVKAQSDLLCPSLMLNGAYKCVKCSKVRVEAPAQREAINQQLGFNHTDTIIQSHNRCFLKTWLRFSTRSSPPRTAWRSMSGGPTVARGRLLVKSVAKRSDTQ